MNGEQDSSDPMSSDGFRNPPRNLGGILRQLGPGLIVAGSIVGSGELIATTATGAEAGFWLLWLILIGCVIKVFTQVEIGRYTLVNSRTTIEGMNEVPGPRFRVGQRKINWLVWYWLAMFLASLAQLGGIVGGVGQAMSTTMPLTENGKRFNQIVDADTELHVKGKYIEILIEKDPDNARSEEVVKLRQEIEATKILRAGLGEKPESVYDDRIWAAAITAITMALLVIGRYSLIQTLATAMVALFTLITIINLVLLQSHETLMVTAEEFGDGMKFRLPPENPDAAPGARAPLATALMTFGIIGVGASELVSYPYWCLEKGYAKFTGIRDGSAAWAERARGWMRVMRWDAWLSMVVYTFATVAFYLLGAATLGRFDLQAKGHEMIHTLAVMYEPVFGSWTPLLFLFGAISVLYSTFFVANASHALVCADALRVFGFGVHNDKQRRLWVRIFSGLFPLLCFIVYCFIRAPTMLVLASGAMQAVMLPMLAGAALYFRYKRNDASLMPGRSWDVMLWLSALGMLVVGGSLIYIKMFT